MDKKQMIEYLDVLIKEAIKQENFALASILCTLIGAILENNLSELSDYTMEYSCSQLKKYEILKKYERLN